jgi:hypothetical protein
MERCSGFERIPRDDLHIAADGSKGLLEVTFIPLSERKEADRVAFCEP